MHWGIPAILLLIVLLLLTGQWLMRKRARSMEWQPAPSSLTALCADDSLIFFEAPRCPACKQLRPLVESLSEERRVPVCWVDIREHPKIATEMRVMGTPTLVLVRGGRIVEVLLGGGSRERIEAMMAKLSDDKDMLR